MKRVFTNSSDVIHLFAQRDQHDARCSNVYFDNIDEIYSYGRHYMLAKFIAHNTILINDRGYSVTTEKHIREITSATSQYTQLFYSDMNLSSVHCKVLELKTKLEVARKPNLYIDPILNMFDRLNKSHDFLMKYKKKNASLWFDSENMMFSKNDKMYREIKKIVKQITNTSGIAELKKFRKEQDRKLKIAQELNLKEQLTKFYNYKFANFRNCGNFDFVRISENGEYIETSQNVKVPIKEAQILYSMILAGKDIRGHQIGYYRVTSINGTLKIGCHDIEMNSVHKIGKVLLTLKL